MSSESDTPFIVLLVGWLVSIAGFLVVFMASIAFLTVIRAVVAIQLWEWFVVPQYHVAPPPLALAIGLMFLLSYLVPHQDAVEKFVIKDKDGDPTGQTIEKKVSGAQIVAQLLSPFITLGFGWITNQFVIGAWVLPEWLVWF